MQFSETEFPAQIEFGGLVLPLSYLFAPGQKDDGISVTIPAGLLQSVSHQALQWSVPGMLPAVVEQWLRGVAQEQTQTVGAHAG